MVIDEILIDYSFNCLTCKQNLASVFKFRLFLSVGGRPN